MGQDWIIIDLDGETIVRELWKIGEEFWCSGVHIPIKTLLRPVPSREPASPKAKALMKPYQRSSKGLFKLPLEILDMVLKELEHSSRGDLLAFIMACRTLFTIGFKRFQVALCKYEVPCAGHRLVCLGECTKIDDLPSGFFPQDLENASTAWGEYSNEDEDDDIQFYRYARNRFPKTSAFESTGFGWQSLWAGCDWPCYSDSESYALGSLLKRDYPCNLSWIVCNLTKRLYFTADAVSKFTGEKPNGPFFGGEIDLEKVLLCQICWSSDSSMCLFYDGPLHRGKWAADRFEITTMDRLPNVKPVEGGKDGEWEDVSDEAVGLIAAIFRADFDDRDPRPY